MALGTDSDCQGLAVQSEPSATSASIFSRTSEVQGIRFGGQFMDQYLLIPFLGGWTSIYQLFWCSPGVQGFDTLPFIIAKIIDDHNSIFPKKSLWHDNNYELWLDISSYYNCIIIIIIDDCDIIPYGSMATVWEGTANHTAANPLVIIPQSHFLRRYGWIHRGYMIVLWL